MIKIFFNHEKARLFMNIIIPKDIIEYISRRLMDGDGNFSIWGISLLKNYQRVSRIAFIPPISREKERDCILLGVRGFRRLSLHSREKCHVVLRAQDIKRLNSIPLSFTYDLVAYKQVYEGIVEKKANYLVALQKKISKTFDLVKPKVLMANSTIDPIDRMWIQEARLRGIRTLCLQHGLYAEVSPPFTLEEDIIDRYIAFDEAQAKIISRNIPTNKIISLGVKEFFNWHPKGKALNICLVGEDFECYGLEDIKKLIINIYFKVARELSINNELNFFYKPHPAEVNDYGITNLVKKISKLENMDVFIGCSSTLLKDMASNKKLVIQILSSSINADNFEKNGYCLSLDNDIDLVDRLSNILTSGSTMPYISNLPLENLLF